MPDSTPEAALIDVKRVKPILDQIANKWSVMVLSVVCEETVRFNRLLKRLDGIRHKALAESLRRLERNGLLNRRVIAGSPVAVEYSITPLGHTRKDPIEALHHWACSHGGAMQQAQQHCDAQIGGLCTA